MPGKFEITARERKRENAKKSKTEFIYSSKHLRQQAKIMSQLKIQEENQTKANGKKK